MAQRLPRAYYFIFRIFSGEQDEIQRTSKMLPFLSKAPSQFFSSALGCRKRHGRTYIILN